MYATIDIGGTNIRIAFSKDGKSLVDIIRLKTPKTHDEIVKTINTHLVGKSIDKIAVGVAGLTDRKKGLIIITPNIELNPDTFVSDLIEQDVQKIIVENDAALAGLAESVVGNGKKYNKCAYITISTGVGGTLITNSQLPNTEVNFEPGHIILERDDFSSLEDMFDGTFEDFCSGLAFERRYGVKPEDCEDSQVWQTYGENLGLGLTNIAILWEPDVIVLGGSITKKSALFLKHTIKVINKYNPTPLPDIKISTLGDTNVMLGGLIALDTN